MEPKWHYLWHLTVWAGPVILGQWVIGWRIFRRNLRAVFCPAVLGTVFFGVTDSLAVGQGIWFFDPKQILGWKIGVLPVEEALFFFLTSLLVSQSLVLFLPGTLRRKG
jgi:lycopene cyclase domain-containing protein